MKKSRPIMFSGPMIRALLEGRKTQTRRIIKPRPTVDGGADDYCPQWWLEWKNHQDGYTPDEMAKLCPYGKTGDSLWVRESFSRLASCDFFSSSVPDEIPSCWYWADGNPSWGDWERPNPSIHMPRWASRLKLELTDVRVEMLQNISEQDAIAEGIEPVLTGACDHCL